MNEYIFVIIIRILSAIMVGTYIGMFFVQARVQRSMYVFGQVFAKSGVTASTMVREILRRAEIDDVSVIYSGDIGVTDHFDPEKNHIALSQSIYNSSSVSALGIAAHEVAHAIQRKQKYGFYVFREKLAPVVEFGSRISIPIILIGLIVRLLFSTSSVGVYIMLVGLGCFLLYSLFMLVTLPVELNASKRALNLLGSTGILDEEELLGAEEVLKAAAATYVYAFFMSFLNGFRYALSKQRQDDDDKNDKDKK